MTGSEPAEPAAGLNIAMLCFIVSRAMEERVSAALAAAGFDDITTAQGRVFAQVAEEGSRVTQLAARARVTKQTAGFLVEALERAGYVRRVPDPADARARLVRIAERGMAAIQVARRAEAEIEAEWISHVGKEPATALHQTLTRLREITDPYA